MAFPFANESQSHCFCGSSDCDECPEFEDGGEVWNPHYNSDYFDVHQVDEYGVDADEFFFDRHDTSIDFEDDFE